jgi:dynein heavy chain
MEETIMKFGDQCVRLPRDLKEWKAYKELKDLIDRTKDVLPIIIDLKKPSIKPRHWIRINEITKSNLNYENPEVMTINDIINANLLQY